MNPNYHTVPPGQPDTKKRLLDAAEQLFAELGYDATSLRAITGKAGVNLAAVNYHFRSKESLIRAVFARRLGPINQERLAMLADYEAEAGSHPVPVENIVRALTSPLLRLQQDSSEGALAFGVLFGRIYAEPRMWRLLREELGDVVPRFMAAIRRALPDLSEEEFFWRIHFTIGAVSHTLAGIPMLELISDGVCKTSNVNEIIERLTCYVSAGLRSHRRNHDESRGWMEQPDSPSPSGRGTAT